MDRHLDVDLQLNGDDWSVTVYCADCGDSVTIKGKLSSDPMEEVKKLGWEIYSWLELMRDEQEDEDCKE